jgi:hypothetical protein
MPASWYYKNEENTILEITKLEGREEKFCFSLKERKGENLESIFTPRKKNLPFSSSSIP